LDEPLVQVDVQLDERSVANVHEGVDLPGLDDENVARAGLTLLAVDGPAAAPSRTNATSSYGWRCRRVARPGGDSTK
jgi:hypothetical protein